MGQAASYAESAVQRALVKVKTEQFRADTELVQRIAALGGGGHNNNNNTALPHSLPSPPEDDMLRPDHYTLDEVRAALPYLPDALWVSLHRITLLYLIDTDHDGRFSRSDVARFMDWAIATMPPGVPQDQLPEALQAQAALTSWHICLLHGQLQRGKALPSRGRWQHRRDGPSALLMAMALVEDLELSPGKCTLDPSPVSNNSSNNSNSNNDKDKDKDKSRRHSINTAAAADEADGGNTTLYAARRLQHPVSADDRQQAAMHFAVWGLRLVHAQEHSRRQIGERQRALVVASRRRGNNSKSNSDGSGSGSGSGGGGGGSACRSTHSNSAPSGDDRTQGEAAADKALLQSVLSRLPSPPPVPITQRVHNSTHKNNNNNNNSNNCNNNNNSNDYYHPGSGTATTSATRVSARLPITKSHPSATRKTYATQPLSADVDEQPLHSSPNSLLLSQSFPDVMSSPPAAAAAAEQQFTEAEEELLDKLLVQGVAHYEQLYAAGWCTVGAVEELYLDLAVQESYGISFWAFCRRLHEPSAAEVETALGLSAEEAVREIDSAVALEDARRRIAFREISRRRDSPTPLPPLSDTLRGARSTSGSASGGGGGSSSSLSSADEDDDEDADAVRPVPSFIVSKYTLLCFIQYFIRSYWNMLESMGFNPASLPVAGGGAGSATNSNSGAVTAT